jgi:hypothetical protein
VSWVLRFAGLATLLAPACWLASDFYQRALAVAVSQVLALVGQPLDLGRVDVAAPFDLGLFVALCLASRRAPWKARVRALLAGLPFLVVVEVLGVVCSVVIMLHFRNQPDAAEIAFRGGFYLSDTIPWVGAGLAWLWLLGPWELQSAILHARGQGRGPATAVRRDHTRRT